MLHFGIYSVTPRKKSRAFGATGTPSAVLVDAEGRIASDVAVGAPAVMGLAGASRAES